MSSELVQSNQKRFFFSARLYLKLFVMTPRLKTQDKKCNGLSSKKDRQGERESVKVDLCVAKTQREKEIEAT